MSLTEILDEVVKLSPAEKRQVMATLSVGVDGQVDLTEMEKEELLLQTMLRKGMIKSIPNRRNIPRKSRPVSIKGEPLSETIIRERR